MGHELFKPETAILVGLETNENFSLPLAESMAELKRLADTAGIIVIGELTQKRPRADRGTYLGEGKLEELKMLVDTLKPDKIIFDSELTPAQERNIEEAMTEKAMVIDRAALIIDIFSLHALSSEGKLQVELAKLHYQLPRLRGLWGHLNRQRGGFGMRDSGEQQLETDKRIIKKRITLLKKEIEKVARDRYLRREKRRRERIRIISLVGYTNSGKSTLLNALTKSDAHVEDKLFATLAPTTRRKYLPHGETVLFTDTVGFIQKLPHDLVVAFRSTLEEVTEASLLLHVVDASNPFFEAQIDAVYRVLEELNCAAKPMITVFNKIDLLTEKFNDELLIKYQPAIKISALQKQGLEELITSLTQQPL
ncbi:MAG: GTPase HflX [bacterium]